MRVKYLKQMDKKGGPSFVETRPMDKKGGPSFVETRLISTVYHSWSDDAHFLSQ
jgi:uncharacterized membrane protein YfbV (UPF0208 family)